MDTKWLRNSFVYLIILVAIIALFFTVFQPGGMDRDSTQISMNELAAAVKRGEVKRIDVAEDKLTVDIPGRGKFTARKERQDTVPQVLAAYGVTPDELARPAREPAAPDLLRRDPALHDAPGPGQQQPGPLVRQEPRAHVHGQQA